MSDYPPIKNGARVRAIRKDRLGYTKEGDEKRLKLSGSFGIVMNHSDGHGLCYEIKFDNGHSAWFDAEELTVDEA